MSPDRFEATYLIETPLNPAHVAEVLAGEQSCGTFTRVEGETDALRERARATVESVELLDVAPAPSLPNGWIKTNLANGKLNDIHVKYAGVPIPKEIIDGAK